ncbi:hypothetical protein [Shimia haliotis]|uniref:hypothetical protein n=1 Tax=Shimia haliotis TaxID=1280847 RepID=UPI00147B00B4|nr:hypothetical protein [Shimia haliotis]
MGTSLLLVVSLAAGRWPAQWKGRAKTLKLSPEGDPFDQIEEFAHDQKRCIAAVEQQISPQPGKDKNCKKNGDGIGHDAKTPLRLVVTSGMPDHPQRRKKLNVAVGF